MPIPGRGIVIELIGDATSIVKSAEQTVKALLSVDATAAQVSRATISANV